MQTISGHKSPLQQRITIAPSPAFRSGSRKRVCEQLPRAIERIRATLDNSARPRRAYRSRDESHEVRHFHMVNGGTMVALLIRNYKVTCACGVTLASGRTLRAIYRHAVLNQSNSLQSERNFDAQLIWRWATAKKNLRGTPVTSLRRDVQRGHFIALGQLIPASACRKQSAEIIFPVEARASISTVSPLSPST